MKIYIDGSKRAAVSRMFPIWKEMGHEVVDNPKDADVQLSVVKIRNKSGLPTVLRLDGIYYDLGANYKRMNYDISISHSIADAVVYQSRFSCKMCTKYLSPRKTDIFDIIYNGVENWENFKPHVGFNIVSCSKWRRHKRLPEMIDIFKRYKTFYPNSGLHILGPMKKGAYEIEAPGVFYYGQVSETEIRKIYETADIYLHLSKKDSCPSSVVEAISAGIPVVTTDACGGATEMCILADGCHIANGDTISLNPDYIYRDPYNVIPESTTNQIVYQMVDIIKHKIRTHLPSELNIETTAKKYIQLMEKLL